MGENKMTKNQKDLLNHITKKNKEIEAWVNEDPKNRWAGLITTDLDHWASYGIYDVAEYERYISANTLYEVYSDKYSKGYARGGVVNPSYGDTFETAMPKAGPN